MIGPGRADVTSRSICSDQSFVPNEVQTRSCSPVSSMVTVEKGASGLRRKILATSLGRRLAVRPDLVERDEQVGEARLSAVLEEVLERRRPA